MSAWGASTTPIFVLSELCNQDQTTDQGKQYECLYDESFHPPRPGSRAPARPAKKSPRWSVLPNQALHMHKAASRPERRFLSQSGVGLAAQNHPGDLPLAELKEIPAASVAVQLARRLKASADLEPGSAVYATIARPGSAGSSKRS